VACAVWESRSTSTGISGTGLCKEMPKTENRPELTQVHRKKRSETGIRNKGNTLQDDNFFIAGHTSGGEPYGVQ